MQKCYHFLFQRYRLEHYTVSSNWLALSAVVVFAVLSLSRSVALFRGVWTHRHYSPKRQCQATEATVQDGWNETFSSVCRLPCSSGPVPRVPSHRQGSDSSLSPWRQTCQCVCGQRVVPLPKQLPSTAQVSMKGFLQSSSMSNKVWKEYFVISRCDRVTCWYFLYPNLQLATALHSVWV